MESIKLISAGILITIIVIIIYSLFFVIAILLLSSLGKLPFKDYSSMLVDHVIFIFAVGLCYICYLLLNQ